MRRILVTGAEGFVGRRLVPRLAARGAAVIACRAPGTSTDASDDAGPSDRVEHFALDIRDRHEVERVFRRAAPDAVVHLAGLSEVMASWRRIDDYYRVNVEGSEHVATVARALVPNCRIVVASSGEVYGALSEAELPAREARGLRPRSPYALTKAAVERLSLPRGAIVARSFNLVGPGQTAQFALPSFAAQLAAIEAGLREPVLHVGNLTPRRDFVHVDDGADAYAVLVERGEPGGVYNVARGKAVAIETALERLIGMSGLQPEIRHDPERMRPADVPAMCGDPGRLRALGWRPKRSLDQALEAIWEDARRRLGSTP